MRRAGALIYAIAALLLGAAPWIARFIPAADIVAPALPLVAVFAFAALLLDRTGASRAVAILAAGGTVLTAGTLLDQALPRDAPAAGSRLVVISHNVATANVDPAGTASALLRSDADILLLQETDGSFAPYLPLLRRAYPYVNPCRRKCSLAIFSRFPVDHVRYRFRDDDGEQVGPPLIEARVRLPGGARATVVTLHLSRHDPARARGRAEDELADAVAARDTGAMILAGDFNHVPWSAAMAHLDDRLAPMRRVTRLLFSFPARIDGRRFVPALVPIDHFYIGAQWGVASVRRLPRTGSDHYAIRTDLVWQGFPPMIPAR